MKGKTGDPQLDGALAKLASALRGLDGTEGRPIARRNARKRVLGALRAVRGQVDQRWPAIVSRKGVQRLTPKTRIKRLQAAGWEATPPATCAAYAAAGVPIRSVREKVTPGAILPNKPPKPFDRITYYVPSWAAAIGPNDAGRLRRAKGNVGEQKIARAEAALKN